MLIEAWESFVRDANLMTRTMGAQRAAALFEHAAVTNKVGQTVLRLPQFVHALVHMAYLRSNPVSALGAAHAKPSAAVFACGNSPCQMLARNVGIVSRACAAASSTASPLTGSSPGCRRLPHG
jgi:hypothetical protein